MELFWNEDGDLNFRVHLKENQAIKYLNKGSQHTKACFKEISLGMLDHLAKLTTVNSSNENLTMDKIYPIHAKSLIDAGLMTTFPTLKECIISSSKRTDERRSKRKGKRAHARHIYVLVCRIFERSQFVQF
mmetsp:Transcript_21389/g.42835  ORF Transcript_21389/g.42835 Transcript_21389/m.42835 type:complete len:131 (+) Transcript_21389:1120-1512(+)